MLVAAGAPVLRGHGHGLPLLCPRYPGVSNSHLNLVEDGGQLRRRLFGGALERNRSHLVAAIRMKGRPPRGTGRIGQPTTTQWFRTPNPDTTKEHGQRLWHATITAWVGPRQRRATDYLHGKGAGLHLLGLFYFPVLT